MKRRSLFGVVAGVFAGAFGLKSKADECSGTMEMMLIPHGWRMKSKDFKIGPSGDVVQATYFFEKVEIQPLSSSAESLHASDFQVK